MYTHALVYRVRSTFDLDGNVTGSLYSFLYLSLAKEIRRKRMRDYVWIINTYIRNSLWNWNLRGKWKKSLRSIVIEYVDLYPRCTFANFARIPIAYRNFPLSIATYENCASMRAIASTDLLSHVPSRYAKWPLFVGLTSMETARLIKRTWAHIHTKTKTIFLYSAIFQTANEITSDFWVCYW